MADFDDIYAVRKGAARRPPFVKSTKISKKLLTAGFMQKRILNADMPQQLPANFRYLEDHQIPEMPCELQWELTRNDFNLYEVGVAYSMNKHARWDAVTELTDGIAQRQDPRTYRHAETHHTQWWPGPSKGHRSVIDPTFFGTRSLSFHKTLPDGTPTHRYAKRSAAQAVTLMCDAQPERPRARGQRRRSARRRWPEPEPPARRAPDEHSITVQYEITQMQPSMKHWHSKLMHERATLDRRRVVHEDGVHRVLTTGGGKPAQFYWEDWLEADPWTEESFEDAARENLFEVTDEDVEPVPEAVVDVSLVDLIELTANKRQKRKNRVNVTPTKVRRGHSILERPWLRRLTSDGTETDEQPESSSSILVVEPPAAVPTFAPSIFTRHLPDWSIESTNLRTMFGSSYFECQCVPRRFCIDITDSVTEVYQVSRPVDKYLENVSLETICVFEVCTASADDYRFAYNNDDATVTVKFWLNSDITENDGDSRVRISDRQLGHDKACTITAIIKQVAVLLGTLANELYPSLDAEELESDADLETLNHSARSRAVAALSMLPDSVLHSNAQCHTTQSAKQIAIDETKLARRLQRQLTVVTEYSSTKYVDWIMSSFLMAERECAVCCAFESELSRDAPLFALAACQHWLCTECWRTHVHTQLQHGHVPVTCPEIGCKTVVDFDTATSFLSLRECRKYARLLTNRYLQQNARTWIWCPNTRCDRVLRTKADSNNNANQPSDCVLVCACGHMWCVSCQQAPHWPIGCVHAKHYFKELHQWGEDKEKRPLEEGSERTVRVKRCPTCNHPMEKSTGCNHMVCRCGGEFCWECGGRWDGGRHYSCKAAGKNFERIELRDVPRPGEMAISTPYYDKCVQHRHARYNYRLVEYKRALMKTKNQRQMRLANDLRGFVPFCSSAHQLLEHTYVFAYFFARSLPRHARFVISALLRRVSRLEFVLSEMESAVLHGKFKKAHKLYDAATIDVRDLADRLATLKQQQPAIAGMKQP